MSGSASLIEALEKNIGEILLGKREPVRLALVALFAGGHVLIEDAPGVGKTVLGKALARSLDCTFRRLQFTPDLLPSDILGSSVYLPNKGDFEFRPGPIFTSVLLALDAVGATEPPDLVITDFNMPHQSGLHLARAVRAWHSDVPVVICSGLITDDLTRDAATIGATLLYKQEFTKKLRALVSGYRPRPRGGTQCR